LETLERLDKSIRDLPHYLFAGLRAFRPFLTAEKINQWLGERALSASDFGLDLRRPRAFFFLI